MITSKFSTGLEKPTIKKAHLFKNEKKIKRERFMVTTEPPTGRLCPIFKLRHAGNARHED